MNKIIKYNGISVIRDKVRTITKVLINDPKNFKLTDYLSEDHFMEVDFDINFPEMIYSESKKYLNDAINGRSVHSALSKLDDALLNDERFWLTVSLMIYPEYVAKSLEGDFEKAVKRFSSNVLFDSTRRRRNYTMRLYWITDISANTGTEYDYSRSDIAFHRIDEVAGFIERKISASKNLSIAYFNYVVANPDLGRVKYNEMLTKINQASGIQLIDLLSVEDLNEMVESKFEETRNKVK